MKFQQSLTFTLLSAAMAVTLGCTAQADTAAAHSTAKPAQVAFIKNCKVAIFAHPPKM